ncbi:hypothetical protein IB276_32890 [Ensifer sp. ENS04]|uniref:hypothetical protein n=1 Tax=Ensifer sp. ENS04 TaxID=2769281 RepID=UPI00177A846D|nr:hypothetical protein [Ensifer sp. ENS04]MBD9544243.1 hypothetical protein [Ensifer sp. ENS04]
MGDFLSPIGTVSYNAATGIYKLSGGGPWTWSNPYTGQPWGYYYWVVLRSD